MKRKFEFRLERVRRVRDIEERVARAERARAEGLARAAESSRDQARDVLAQSRASLQKILTGSIDPRTVLSSQRVLDGELTELRRRVESARTLRIQAERIAGHHSARKSAARALEELAGRARERHAAAIQAHDGAIMDEVAQQRAGIEAERRADRNEDGENASRSKEAAADHGPDTPRAP